MSRIGLLRLQAPMRSFLFKSPGQIFSKQGPKNQLFKRFQSTLNQAGKPTPSPQTPKKPISLKHLMKEYGYAGLGVYLALSMVDLPICYVLVHSLGQEQIEYYENKVKQTFGYGVSDEELQRKHEINRIHESAEDKDELPQQGGALRMILAQFSWTEFAIAYGIHKSLIFIRLPITAAITPGIVKGLRRWGFKIGSDKLSTTASIAKDTIKDITASNPKFGTRPNGKKKWFSWFF